MPRSGISGLYCSSIFHFWGISILLSIVVTLIYIPTNRVEMFLFPHILTSICCCSCYWWYPLWLGWGGVSMQFDLHFLCDKGWWAFLNIFIGCLCLFWELSIRFICPFIQWVVDFWEVDFLSSLYVLVINALLNVWLAKISLPFGMVFL
jgi:hypothetical protein